MSDAEVLREVTAVRGIGPWTGQMYLMHTLARPDVWPVGDFGVRSGWSLVHGDDEVVSERDLSLAGERFEGLRSSVAWYCWEAVHVHRGAH
jgi:DNA-3-methyladenine glycosylase II